MEFPTLINRASAFLFNGCWVVFFIFIQILIEHSVGKQLRHLWHLIRIYTVCLCPNKRIPDLYGLITVLFISNIKYTHIFFSNNMKNVLCSQVSLASIIADAQGAGNFSAFRALRTLRAFRPLRAISRWQGMKVILF